MAASTGCNKSRGTLCKSCRQMKPGSSFKWSDGTIVYCSEACRDRMVALASIPVQRKAR